MSLTDEARKVLSQRSITNAKKRRPDHPTGFEPGIDTEKGIATLQRTRPIQADEYADAFTELLEDWGFDPELFTIQDDTVEVRTWEGLSNVLGPYKGEVVRFWYYKAKVAHKRPGADIGELTKRIRSRKPLKSKQVRGGDRTFVVCNADWQLGKRDGQGTEFTINAIKSAMGSVKQRYEDLRAQGVKIDTLLIANLGDLIEGCDGFYPMQTYQVELSRREQIRLGRELLTEQIMAWADDFDKVLVVAVGGNHGEHRKDGKVFTNLGDNDDVALVEQVADAFELAANAAAPDGGRYGHVSFLIPENELSFTLDVSGTIVGITHGHVAGGRRSASRDLSHTRVWDWWYGQSMGRQPVADADLLLTGHYHYLSLFRQGTRTAIQAPAMEYGSQWFIDANGMESHAATLTLVVGGGVEGGQPGWSDLYITSA